MDRIALGIVKNRLGKVLIIKRKNPEQSNKFTKLFWAFPGGRPEGNETLKETVAREVLEETCIHIRVDLFLSKRMHPDFPVEVHYFACTPLNDDEPICPDNREVEDVRWVTANKVEQYFSTNFSPDVRTFLKT